MFKTSFGVEVAYSKALIFPKPVEFITVKAPSVVIFQIEFVPSNETFTSLITGALLITPSC